MAVGQSVRFAGTYPKPTLAQARLAITRAATAARLADGRDALASYLSNASLASAEYTALEIANMAAMDQRNRNDTLVAIETARATAATVTENS